MRRSPAQLLPAPSSSFSGPRDSPRSLLQNKENAGRSRCWRTASGLLHLPVKTAPPWQQHLLPLGRC